MIELLLPLFALLALAAGAPEVTQYSLDGANLISTSGSNLGLTERSLTDNNWKTVSINGNQVTFVSEDCVARSSPVEELSSQDERVIKGAIKRLIDGQRKMILGANGGISTSGNNNIGMNNRNNRYSSIIIDSNSGNVMSGVDNVNVETGNVRGKGLFLFIYNGISMQKTDEHNYSIAKDNGMPNNLARVFVNGDVLTYVYRDGRVLMKPVKCMQQDETQVLVELKAEVERAEAAHREARQQRDELREERREAREREKEERQREREEQRREREAEREERQRQKEADKEERQRQREEIKRQREETRAWSRG